MVVIAAIQASRTESISSFASIRVEAVASGDMGC